MAALLTDRHGLVHEYRVLLAEYGRAQARCSALLASRAAEIAALQAQVMRLRASTIVQQTVLAFERQDRARMLRLDTTHGVDEAAFEASLAAADMVICQTGCLSQNAYWRVHDHCQRTGKTCVLVPQPSGTAGLLGDAPGAPQNKNGDKVFTLSPLC